MNESQMDICNVSELWTDQSYFEFLTNQIKLLNHFDCNHVLSNSNPLQSPTSLTSPNSPNSSDFLTRYNCCECTREFVKYSSFQKYFENLYVWFKQIETYPYTNNKYFFHPVNIVKCFQSISNYLILDELDYFNSPWLDSLFKVVTTIKYNKTISINSNNSDNSNNSNNSDNSNDNNNLISTIFEMLCIHGHLETIQWFYNCEEKNISLNTFQKERVFINACKLRFLDVVKWLLTLEGDNRINKDIVNGDGLWWACSNGHVGMVEFLLNLKEDQKIKNNKQIKEAFIEACTHGHLEVVKLLLELKEERKIDLNHDVSRFFGWSVVNGHIELTKFLLSLKGDQRIDTHYYQQLFDQTWSFGSIDIIKLLLDFEGVDIHHHNDFAFQRACKKNRINVVEFFLKLDGDRRISDLKVIKEVFINACRDSNVKIVKLLLDLDGDRRINDYSVIEEGFVLALDKNNIEMIELLLSLDDDRRISRDTIMKKKCQNFLDYVHERILKLMQLRVYDL